MLETQRRYGIIEQTKPTTDVDYVCESIQRLGYGVLEGGYSQGWLSTLSDAFDSVLKRYCAEHGGRKALRAIDEHNTIRLPMYYEPIFLELATNAGILEICRKLISGYSILNQQNGIINPARSERYNQGAWHRDLPYQHFVSSRPLAVNALFCLDPFTIENGATKVLPASHRQEAFPSERFVEQEAVAISAPAGSFIVLDCMTFHTGGVNSTDRARRAVNHVYSIPLLRQQIDLPSALGDDFTADSELRKLLGYGVSTPVSVGSYLATRTEKSRIGGK
jgi:ectoine hydroxylase-related dioxygenase (phytanoyl-CoA dioxygenase family)